MKAFQLAAWSAVQCVIQIGLCVSPHAFEFNGAWTADKSVCPKIFIKKDASIAFAPNSELWGKGFIVEGNSIKSQRMTCAIKHRKIQASQVYILAQCADDIMIDQVQLHIKITGDDSIMRFIPEIEGLETSYVRCAF